MPLRSRNKRSIANRTKRHRKKLTSKRYRKLKGGMKGKGPKPKGSKPSGQQIQKKPTLKESVQVSSKQFDNFLAKRPPMNPALDKFQGVAKKVIRNKRSTTVNDSGVKPMENAYVRAEFEPGKNLLAGLNLANTSNTRTITGMLSNKKIDEMRKKQEFDNAFKKELELALVKPKAPIRRAISSPTNVKPKPIKVQKAKSFNNMTKKQMEQEQKEVEEKKVKLVEISQKVATNIIRASKQLDDDSRKKIAERFAQYLAETYGGVGAEDIKVNEIARSLNEQINSVIEARPTTKKSVRENYLKSIMNLFK